MKLCYYFKIFGLAQDANGNPAYAGMSADFGVEAKLGVTYSDIIKPITDCPNWRQQAIKLLHLEKAGIKESDIQFITPEEYIRDFNDEEFMGERNES